MCVCVFCSYYDQITSLESKVPPSEVQIPFKWKDAFNKMTSFFANGKVSISMFKLYNTSINYFIFILNIYYINVYFIIFSSLFICL